MDVRTAASDVIMPRRKRRTREQLHEHYLIERELADRLRNASPNDREHLYSQVYDELFMRVAHHPQLRQKADPLLRKKAARMQMRLIRRFLDQDATFLEIGAGDCSLSMEAAKTAKFVYALDVSEEITRSLATPENFRLIISAGGKIPFENESINVAYSNQLMEHLHPDDAFAQLQSIYRVLSKGGCYICITPNRVSGPHDISQFFDETARGFHMKEYTIAELEDVFRQAGFKKMLTYIGGKGIYARCPAFLIKSLEHALGKMPFAVRRSISGFLPIKAILGAIIVGKKE